MSTPLNSNTSIVKIEDEMQQSYMDYAMSVIIGRALPDVRDGLKPVQRRVLYAMMGEGLASNRKHSKCAGVVGEVLKRLHPHGDSSVYDALVRLAQPWNLRYPLVDGQGNFGSIDGDPAAAYRYTECRMTAASEALLADLDKDTVDFIPNFDDSNVEPVVLPSAVPNLLVNGSDGIAVGMATHIPPHNLTEVVNATVAFIKNPQISLRELIQHMPGPDFPTGGLIYGREAIVSAYATGKGIIQLRARTTVEQIKTEKREAQAIVVTEIPFQVNKARLIERIADLVNNKEIDGIARLRDETDRSGMRIVIELKRDATAEVVLSHLFKMTPMQQSFGIINLAIAEGRPMVLSLAELLGHFVDHRRDVVTRRTQFELRQAQERMHILEGFKIALLNLDEVIALIRKSPTPQEAKDGLCQRFTLTPIQSQAILDLRLQKLTGMERLAIEREHEELAARIAELLSILGDPHRIDGIIVSELESIRERFGDARRTEIVDAGTEIMVEDLIEDEEMVVTITHRGYAKRTPVSEYRVQGRGGKGIIGAASEDDDFVEHLFVASTLSYVMVFTTLGRAYWLKVYHLPESGRSAKGRALVNLLQLQQDEVVSAILPIREFVENRWIVMATRQGVVKKSNLAAFSRVRKAGLVACTLDEGDELIGAMVCGAGEMVMLATKMGMAIRFPEDDVREMGREARGVKGIALEGDDRVVGMAVVPAEGQEGEQTLLTVCENGYGKRTSIADYRIQGRGGRGVIDIQTNDRNGLVIGVAPIAQQGEVMVITSGGKIIRFAAQEMSVRGRNTMGVRLVTLDEGERVLAIAPILIEQSGDAVVDGAATEPTEPEPTEQ